MNLLIIDSNLTNINVFLNGLNSNTYYVTYNNNTTVNNIKTAIYNLNISSFSNLGFVFINDMGVNQIFIENEAYISQSSNNIISNKSTQLISFLITTYNIQTIDFLTSNLLSNITWEKYFEYIISTQNKTVRASKDVTGNLYYGINWLSQVNKSAINTLYFTSKIYLWSYSLNIYECTSRAILNDGNLVSWGTNLTGNFGNGSSYHSTTPIIAQNVKTTANAVALDTSLSGNNTIILMSDFTVKVIIQYNDATKTHSLKNSACTIPTLSNIVQVTIGHGNSFAVLDKNGYVWTWCECNDYDSLYDNYLFTSNTPIKNNQLTNIVYIEQSKFVRNLVAIDNIGNIYIYGDNSGGQYGSGAINKSSVTYSANKMKVNFTHITFNALTGYFKKITFFPVSGVRVVKCVFIFTALAVLLENSDVYIWGYNHDNIFNKSNTYLTPTKLSFKNTIDICATENMLVILDCQFNVYYYGIGFNNTVYSAPTMQNYSQDIYKIFSNNNQIFAIDKNNGLSIDDNMNTYIKQNISVDLSFNYSDILNSDGSSKIYNLFNYDYNVLKTNGIGFTGIKNSNVANAFLGFYIGKNDLLTKKRRIINFNSTFNVPLNNTFTIQIPDNLTDEEAVNIQILHITDNNTTKQIMSTYNFNSNSNAILHKKLLPAGMKYNDYIHFDIINSNLTSSSTVYFIEQVIGATQITTSDTSGYGAYYLYLDSENNLTTLYNYSVVGVRVFTKHFSDVIITDSLVQICFKKNSLVLLGDGTYKKINEIKRGDILMQDDTLKTTAIVSKVYEQLIDGQVIKIPKGLIGNEDDIISTKNHPIWINKNSARIYANKIIGVEKINICDNFYNIQYDDENDPIRNKPILIFNKTKVIV